MAYRYDDRGDIVMGKYYKAEDVINTLAEQWHYETTIECPYAADDIEEWKQNARELFADLPTIEVSEDCMSREWLLNAFGLSEKTRKWDGDHSGYDTMMLYEIQDYIEDAPSVVPSRAEGEWIDKGDYAECSNCGAKSETQFNGVEPVPRKTNFCPNCGAKMKG